MDNAQTPMSPAGDDAAQAAYQAPAVIYLGTVADLTRKDVGAADGSTFLGIDIGS